MNPQTSEHPADRRVENQFGERVARIETDLTSFKDEVRSELRTVVSSVRGLTDAVNSQSRPNWQAWIGVGGLVFMLVGGGCVYVSMMIQNRVNPLETRLIERTSEIETQFNAEAQEQNIQHSYQERMNAVLWNAGKLGEAAKYPEAPFYYPNIAKGHE